MKEELIKQSEEKGFISRDRLVKVNESYYYLWMCELQKWLRDKHNIDVQAPCIRFNSLKVKGYQYAITSDNYQQFTQEGDYNTYEQALEQGLIEGLKLIK